MSKQYDLFCDLDRESPNDAHVVSPHTVPTTCKLEAGTPDTEEVSSAEDPAQRQQKVQELAGIIDRVYALNHYAHNTFADVVEMWKWVLHRHTKQGEKRYMEVVARLQPEAVRAAPEGFGLLMQHFVMEQRFSDLLGPVYMELAGRWKQGGLGQYFTPWEVCLMMAQMTLGDIAEPSAEQPLRVNEPCVGSGTMLLAAKQAVADQHGRGALRWLRVSGQDIDQLCVDMSEVQLLFTDDSFIRDWMLMNIHTMGVEVRDDE